MVTESRRKYMADYNLKRYHKRMGEAIEILGGACVVCGATENLQLDHLDPDGKSFSVGKLWSLAMDTFLEELTKCQLLCDDCHKTKTLTFDQEKIQSKRGATVKGPRSPRQRRGVLTQKKSPV